jgi:hypothetical protein
MIKEYEIYHGSVLSRLMHSTNAPVTIKALTDYGNLAYLLNQITVLYIKYSTKRLSPWSFSFSNAHHIDILSLQRQFGSIVLALVCGNDGIVTINFSEIQHLLGNPSEKGASISCSRKPREMYTVKGTAGELNTKIGDCHLIEKLITS